MVNSDHQNGGARAGAGRPMRASYRIQATVSNVTRVKLERLAKIMECDMSGGGWKSLGPLLDKLMEDVEFEEPDYIKLARSIKSLVVRPAV